MKFIIATHNKKKCAEMQRILSPLGIEVATADMLGITLTDAEETGTTFEENAYIKAYSGCMESGLPCIADDSGLEVDCLGGEPGVYSARYAGEHGNDKANNDKLLKKLDGVEYEKRTARFVCCVCVHFPDGRYLVVRGKCEGKIGIEEKGEGGFGYDPLFYYPPFERSFAQLSMEEKNSVSHRGRAVKALMERFDAWLNEVR